MLSEEEAKAMIEQRNAARETELVKGPCVAACSAAVDLRITTVVMVYRDNGKIEGNSFTSTETE